MLTLKQQDEMLLHAALAKTVYQRTLGENMNMIQGLVSDPAAVSGWEQLKISTALEKRLHEICPGLKKMDDGHYVDPDSGLVFQPFGNSANKKVTIAFGGTLSGTEKGDLLKLFAGNFVIGLRQWRANISNASGMHYWGGPVPDSFQRAAEVVAAIKEFGAPANCTVSVCGHSKGGIEAEYAALMNNVLAYCFGTPEMHEVIHNEVGTLRHQMAGVSIHNIFTTGDLIPKAAAAIGKLTGMTVRHGHAGTGYWIKPAPVDEDTSALLRYAPAPIASHDGFLESALYHSARNLMALFGLSRFS